MGMNTEAPKRRLMPIAQAGAHFTQIRLIATDMDGTLTTQEKFTPALLRALEDLAAAHFPVLIVTGRSAGWVSSLAHYLPVAGAIAENGGIFYQKESSQLLVPIRDIPSHRQKLAAMFADLQAQFPQIRESNDNPFRITDWTFDVAGLTIDDLHAMDRLCQSQGWSFTYSTVQCHIKPFGQEKAAGLQQVLQQAFPEVGLEQVITVGDSPNDESLFGFPVSVGVANVKRFVNQINPLPRFVTESCEGSGFCELTELLLSQKCS